MRTYSAHSTATPEAAWALLARPARWHEWAPHIRGAWGLGSPEVRKGSRGAARLLGVVPVPATVTQKQPGRSWTWRVGPIEMDHRVEARGGGCVVAIDVRAPAGVEQAVGASYGPLIQLLVSSLARRAEG